MSNLNRILIHTAAVICALVSAISALAQEYPNYFAAKRSLAAGDCPSAVDYLNEFIAANQPLLEAHPSFAARVNRQIKICTGEGGGVSGVTIIAGEGEDSEAVDILPEEPPEE